MLLVSLLFLFLISTECISEILNLPSRNVKNFYDTTYNRKKRFVYGFQYAPIRRAINEKSRRNNDEASENGDIVLIKDTRRNGGPVSPDTVVNTAEVFKQTTAQFTKAVQAAFEKAKEYKLCRVMLRLNRASRRGLKSKERLRALIERIHYVNETDFNSAEADDSTAMEVPDKKKICTIL